MSDLMVLLDVVIEKHNLFGGKFDQVLLSQKGLVALCLVPRSSHEAHSAMKSNCCIVEVQNRRCEAQLGSRH